MKFKLFEKDPLEPSQPGKLKGLFEKAELPPEVQAAIDADPTRRNWRVGKALLAEVVPPPAPAPQPEVSQETDSAGAESVPAE